MISDHLPDKVLVILLGASEWTKAPNLGKSEAFSNSAQKTIDYFFDKFGLPPDNLLNLFDSESGCDEIDESISNWLEQKIPPHAPGSSKYSDLIVIYVGHGDFINGKDEFILAIRKTRESNYATSSILISSLASTIKEKARYLRRYIILDCCYAASAFKHFQSGDISRIATNQVVEAFRVYAEGLGKPTRGTALLCSSRHNKPSRLSPDNQSTMFSEAVVHSLVNGNPKLPAYFSIEEVCSQARIYLTTKYENDAPIPEVHAPDQSEGNVAQFPLFPNFSASEGDKIAEMAVPVDTSREVEEDRANTREKETRANVEEDVQPNGISKTTSDFLTTFGSTPEELRSIKKNYSKAQKLEEQGDLVNALAYYRKVQALEPNFTDINSRIAGLILAIERKAVIDRIKQSIADNPDNVENKLLLGTRYFSNKEYENAKAIFQDAMNSRPEDFRVYSIVGRLYHDKEMWDDAEKCFRTAVSLQPNNSEAHNQLGSTLFAQQKWEKALGSFKTALRLKSDPQYRNNLIMARNRHEKFIENFGTKRQKILLALVKEYRDLLRRVRENPIADRISIRTVTVVLAILIIITLGYYYFFIWKSVPF